MSFCHVCNASRMSAKKVSRNFNILHIQFRCKHNKMKTNTLPTPYPPKSAKNDMIWQRLASKIIEGVVYYNGLEQPGDFF
jgi:hypothetical protein